MQLKDVFKSAIRPKILLKAARIGLKTYSRNRDLKRLIRAQLLPKPGHAMNRLANFECTLEEARETGNAAYDMMLHIQVMTALLQEIYLLPKTGQKP